MIGNVPSAVQAKNCSDSLPEKVQRLQDKQELITYNYYGELKWTNIYAPSAVMCTIRQRVIQTMKLTPGQSGKTCLMIGNVRFAVLPKIILRN